MSVKDDLLSDMPQVYPGLPRPEVERLLTLLDQSASLEGAMSLSIATAIAPMAPAVASRIESYGKSGDVDDYVRMLRGAVVLLLQQWQPEEQPPTPERISEAVATLEADG